MSTIKQSRSLPSSPNDRVIDCGKSYGEEKEKLTCCDKKEVCAKAKAQNDPIKENQKKDRRGRIDTTSDAYDTARNVVGPGEQSNFRKDFMALTAMAPGDGWTEDDFKAEFLAECRFEEWKKTRSIDNLDADHVIELQFGGAPGWRNLKFTSSRVNRMFGASASHYDEGKHTAIRPHGNCDCSNTAKCA